MSKDEIYGDIGYLISSGSESKKLGFIYTCDRCGKREAFPLDSMVCSDKENPKFISRWSLPVGKYEGRAGKTMCRDCVKEYDAMFSDFMERGRNNARQYME